MRTLIALFVALSASLAIAEDKPVEIPLKEVWATNMPGTREIGKFDSIEAAERSIVTKTLRQIDDARRQDAGMAVQGEGLKAIEEFYRIRSEKLPRNKVSANSPVSLIFYTAGIGFHTSIQRIEKQDNHFTIQYRFVPPPENRGIHKHLAVIPIGEVPPGKYEVKIEQLPLEQKYVDLGYAKMLPRQTERVCKSFSFLVVKPEVQQ